jgi:hypothetical protein
VIPAPPNPFYSHSYSYGYTVPQLVTGALADWKMTDQWSVQAGRAPRLDHVRRLQ